MKNKNERLQVIKKLIGNKKISSQEELLKLLVAEGFNMTQATLSRDLHFLKVSKMPDTDDTYIYVLKDQEIRSATDPKTKLPINGFLSIQFAKGMGIIRTLPGFASGIASTIDTMQFKEVAGTIAGDDTILLIPTDGSKNEEIIRKFSKFIPDLKSKII